MEGLMKEALGILCALAPTIALFRGMGREGKSKLEVSLGSAFFFVSLAPSVFLCFIFIQTALNGIGYFNLMKANAICAIGLCLFQFCVGKISMKQTEKNSRFTQRLGWLVACLGLQGVSYIWMKMCLTGSIV